MTCLTCGRDMAPEDYIPHAQAEMAVEESMRVFRPLKPDHPLVVDGDTCPVCKARFAPGARIVLTPVRPAVDGVETVQALPLHATCALAGAETALGVIERIKDGDGSPYPVIMVDGKREYRIEEVEGLSQ